MTSKRPLIVAFYSYKGGVGRTTALYHTAVALARAGRRIVLLDLDLGAPSLWALAGDSTPAAGFVECLQSWIIQDAASTSELLREVKLVSAVSGSVFLLGAGRMDAAYLETLQTLDWLSVINRPTLARQQENTPGRPAFFDQLIEDISAGIRPDAILVDAPTGFSETSNLILRLLADLVVLVFSPTPVQLTGIGRLVSLLTSEQQQRASNHERPRPDLLGVASTILAPTIGGTIVKRIAESFQFLNEARWAAIPPHALTNALRDELRLDIATIPYDPGLVYLERPDWKALSADSPSPFQDIISYVQNALPEVVLDPEPRLDDKRPLLAEMKPQFLPFAEETRGPPERLFLRTNHVDEFLDDRVVLILGGKGSGKTALFQFVTRNDISSAKRVVAVHGPGVGLAPDVLSRLLDGAPEAQDTFWRTYLLASIDLTDSMGDMRPVLDTFRNLQRNPSQANDRLLNSILQFLSAPNAGVQVDACWRRVDQHLAQTERHTSLCLDGLDAAFKNNVTRRERSLAALMVGWQATFAQLKAVELKIFLRNDIWEQLAFPEKSHLRGRAMKLTWESLSLWQMVIKRALASVRFENWASMHAPIRVEPKAVEATGLDALIPYLDRLLERRIWTGKNALSRNWIQNRLTDAQGTIYPRDLLSLLWEAMTEEERRLQQGQAVANASVISRQSLPEALVPMSRQRVQALEEEYQELKPVLESLRGLQARSPDTKTLRERAAASPLGEDKTLQLLSEAGFVSFEETGGYRVPDLYRHGLDMTRMGPW